MVPGIFEKYPVEIYHTSTTGLFIICEPVGSDSISKIKRVKIQEELTSVISHLEKTDPQSVNYRNVTIGELVAVRMSNNDESKVMWMRGLIKNKMFRKNFSQWCVLLHDWGCVIEVALQDVVPLPEQFASQPFYSRHAVLDGIQPVSRTIDLTTLAFGKVAPTTKYDQSAKYFIEETLDRCGRRALVSVKGCDDQLRLHASVYLELSGSEVCLNNLLCERQYAQPVLDENQLTPIVVEKGKTFWETFPLLSSQDVGDATIDGFVNFVEAYNEKTPKKIETDLSEEIETCLSKQTIHSQSVMDFLPGNSSRLSEPIVKMGRGRGNVLLEATLREEKQRKMSLSSVAKANENADSDPNSTRSSQEIDNPYANSSPPSVTEDPDTEYRPSGVGRGSVRSFVYSSDSGAAPFFNEPVKPPGGERNRVLSNSTPKIFPAGMSVAESGGRGKTILTMNRQDGGTNHLLGRGCGYAGSKSVSSSAHSPNRPRY